MAAFAANQSKLALVGWLILRFDLLQALMGISSLSATWFFICYAGPDTRQLARLECGGIPSSFSLEMGKDWLLHREDGAHQRRLVKRDPKEIALGIID